MADVYALATEHLQLALYALPLLVGALSGALALLFQRRGLGRRGGLRTRRRRRSGGRFGARLRAGAARAPGAGRLRRLQVLRGAARALTPGAVAPLEGRTAEDDPFPMAGYDEELLADRSTANRPPRTCR